MPSCPGCRCTCWLSSRDKVPTGQKCPTCPTMVGQRRDCRAGLRQGGRDHVDVGSAGNLSSRIDAAAFIGVGSTCGPSARAGAQRAARAILKPVRDDGTATVHLVAQAGRGTDGAGVSAGGGGQIRIESGGDADDRPGRASWAGGWAWKKGPTSCPAGPATPPPHGSIDQAGGRRERGRHAVATGASDGGRAGACGSGSPGGAVMLAARLCRIGCTGTPCSVCRP